MTTMRQADGRFHPVATFMDYAASTNPSDDEIVEIARDVTRRELGDSALTEYEVKDMLDRASRKVARLRDEGASGPARIAAREAAQEIVAKLPAYKKPRDRRSVREIVDSIPRNF